MSEPKYQARHNSEGLPYVDGPGDGLGYYAHTLNPGLTCVTKEEAERAAKIANIAYERGYWRAQLDIRKSLGLGS
jgi:hypothetical protein